MDSGFSLADIKAVTDNNEGFGGSGWWIILLFLIGGFGGGGWGGRTGSPVTEADLCTANNFSNLQNSVGRLHDLNADQNMLLSRAICDLGYQNAQLINGVQMQEARDHSDMQRQVADCCCTTQRAIDGVNYNGAIHTAEINATTTAGVQKILDKMCEMETQGLRDRVQHLEMQNAMCGVIRYPSTTAYSAGQSPFWGNSCGTGYGTTF